MSILVFYNSMELMGFEDKLLNSVWGYGLDVRKRSEYGH